MPRWPGQKSVRCPKEVSPANRPQSWRYCSIVAGTSVLYLGSYLLRTLCLSLIAVVLYNMLYTRLKKRTIAAIIPGAISGALPPYIGWTSAGGDPFSGTALLLSVLFILWQVPHSLLILLRHKDDYLHNALPSLVKILPESSLKRICQCLDRCIYNGGTFFMCRTSWFHECCKSTLAYQCLGLICYSMDTVESCTET